MGSLQLPQQNILDEGGIKVRLCNDLLEELEEDAIEWRIFQAASAGLGQRSTDGEGNDNIVGILGGSVQLLVRLSSCRDTRRARAHGWDAV